MRSPMVDGRQPLQYFSPHKLCIFLRWIWHRYAGCTCLGKDRWPVSARPATGGSSRYRRLPISMSTECLKDNHSWWILLPGRSCSGHKPVQVCNYRQYPFLTVTLPHRDRPDMKRLQNPSGASVRTVERESASQPGIWRCHHCFRTQDCPHTGLQRRHWSIRSSILVPPSSFGKSGLHTGK